MSAPISLPEFAAALRRCLPASLPASPAIAVANSAGPDSTCLLLLLSLLSPRLLSVHVDHALQPASPRMAARAAANAASLRVSHHLAHIPWGVPPFPQKPSSGPLEQLARDARYRLIFDAMTRHRAPVVALAHHADDQVETSLMRLARGSTTLGAAGMHPCRRWGMGSGNAERDLAWVGHRGLHRFIVRPLLHFPKDRILATCHAHQLHYVCDPTNFQPQLTLRNAVRHFLRHPSDHSPTPSVSLQNLNDAVSFLRSLAPAVVGLQQSLYSAVNNLAASAAHVDLQVTSHLTECVLPSPMGTLLLSSSRLLHITDLDVRRHMILRVIRYVSFHPWGSLRADADRRRTSIHRIATSLWSPHSRTSHLKKFTAGGGVLWSPAIFNPHKRLRVGNQCLHFPLQRDDSFCWLASRIPPFSKNPQEGAGSRSRLLIDLTERLRAAVYSDVPAHPLQVLYDCRFLLCIDPFQMPTHVKSALGEHDKAVSIKILPFTQYYWPKVVLQRESLPDEVLAVPQEKETGWISIQWVRLLDAT